MAELVNMAGEGLPLYLWSKMASPGESPWEVGRQRAGRDYGSFSYRNAVVLEEGGALAACLIGYPLDDDPPRIEYSDIPALFVPLQELEERASGTWYVNVIATYPTQRGKGFATRLLSIAEKLGDEAGKRGMSIIVSDANLGARRLYERLGYREHATRPMVKENWETSGENWVLLLKRTRR